ncbi:MAG: winged helix-turn-helix domain-containing protein [Thermoprotei archaeon]|nr:winged helix-turn-helix domain-containing protein [Thermoprotei archaeon]
MRPHFMLASLSAIIVMLAFSVTAEVSGYSMVEVYPDGLAVVEYHLKVETVPSRVSLRAPPQAILVSVYVDGEPVAYDYDAASGSLSFAATASRVLVRVYTPALTSKEGILWRLNLGPLEYTTMITLPRESITVSVKPEQYNVRIIEGKVYLEFSPGATVSIEYVTVPATATPPPTTPPPPAPTQPEKREWPPLWAILALIIVGLAIVAAIILVLRRSKTPAGALIEVETETLDERDKQIIETIKSRGELTASEIMRITGIPKTPLYRKLEKLEKLGLITSALKAGVKVYRLKKEVV